MPDSSPRFAQTDEVWHLPDLLPHAGEMILLDRIEACGDGTLVAVMDVRPGLLSAADGSLPAYAGIELLAQAIAALAGIEARREQRPVKAGLLLGSRHYRARRSSFAVGTRLRLSVERSLQDEQGFGVFDGRIEVDGELAIEARLSVYQPENIDAILGAAAP